MKISVDLHRSYMFLDQKLCTIAHHYTSKKIVKRIFHFQSINICMHNHMLKIGCTKEKGKELSSISYVQFLMEIHQP